MPGPRGAGASGGWTGGIALFLVKGFPLPRVVSDRGGVHTRLDLERVALGERPNGGV